MSRIHPTAIVDPQAQLDDSVEIGPYTLIGPHVSIGARTRVAGHCVIEGHTHIGQDNRIFQFCSLGAAPQDKKYAGEPTRLTIGHRNTIREFCSFNVGTVQDGGLTSLGDDNWVMAYVHLAHDCHVGHHTILANNTQLAGHVHVGDWVILGGFTGVHQFVKIGAHAMTGIYTALSQDVPPFMMVNGNPAQCHGINSEGLRRRGFGAEQIAVAKQIHKLLYRQGLTLADARQAIEQLGQSQEAARDFSELTLDFLARAQRGIVR